MSEKVAGRPPNRAELVIEARDIIANGSKSFRSASALFDEKTRERAWLLYAWCRACDDLTDGQTLGHDMTVPNRSKVGAQANRRADRQGAGR